ncbi:histidine phosphatase family protein [Marisediminicola senii]|uniref:histidine phosphatase family protein n=1 Tax=Marisediminicola senii TaxID=2711233 RepID=UPI0013EA8360|nr:histidine phosphatase family protein [Marisediminicola senii]
MASTPHHHSSRLVLVRHGETEWSRTGQHTSVTDLPLTETGEQQARNVGTALAGRTFGLVLSSPRQRALQTAELAGYGAHMHLDENLSEWDYGAYEGRTSVDIVAGLGHPWNLWLDGVPAGETPGESRDDVRRRATAVIERSMPVLDGGDDVLCFAHGHMLRAIAAAWIDLPAQDGAVFSLATGTISELGFEHERAVIMHWNSEPRTA